MDQAFTYFADLLESNDFLQGGFILGLIASLGVWARRLPGYAWAGLKRLLIVECDIQQRDEAFSALVHWLAHHPYGKRVKRFTASVVDDDHEGGGERRGRVVLSPAPGLHLLWYAGRLVKIKRDRERSKEDGGVLFGIYEQFTLQTVGRGRGVLERLVREAVDLYQQRYHDRIHLRGLDRYGNWSRIGTSQARRAESLVLPGSMLDDVLADVGRFFGAEDWYRDMGLPHRRGYLLHGPPGTGKSTLCSVVASRFGLDVSVVPLSDGELSDTTLVHSLGNAPLRSLLLIEDIDCLYEADRTRKDAKGVTLSGLLNAMDGAVAQEGRVVFMTTNHLDRLDPALVRPGRADVAIEFRMATLAQIERMYMRFFPGREEEAERFALEFGDQKVSAAEVQRVLMDRHAGGAS